MLGAYLISGGQGSVDLERVAAVVGRVELPELVDAKGKEEYLFPASRMVARDACHRRCRTDRRLSRLSADGGADRSGRGCGPFYRVEMPLLSILFAMENRGEGLSNTCML